ncbi:MAG: protein kinase [Elusimicrobiota bacterium]
MKHISALGEAEFGRLTGVPRRAEASSAESKEPAAGSDPSVPDVRPSVALVNFAEDVNVRDSGGSPAALRERGLVLSSQHNYSGAYKDLDQVIGGGNPDVKTLDAYGDAAYHLGDYATALNAANMALRLDPNDKSAFSLKKFAENRPPTVRLPSSLGELAASRSPEAMPGEGASAFAAGGFAPSGMTVEQAAALARQAQAPGSDAPARSNEFTKDTANALRVKDYSTAYRLATQAINLSPRNAQALNYRAMALNQLRRFPDAVQDASAALILAPGSAAVLHTRSWAFSKQGKYKEGLQDAQSASAAEPTNPLLYQDTALALAGLGDRAGTLAALRRSAELDPRFTGRLERAVQLPQDSDMTLLFDDGAAAAAAAPAPPAPGSRERRFLRLSILSIVGGLLIALGVLHIVSASWRDRVRMTVRRVLGPSPAVAAEAAPVESPSRGTFWTQYQVIKEIGLGGMGVVYEATDRSLERRVAVKKMRDEIRSEPDDRRRFVNEARLVAQLHHPNIVDIYGIVEEGVDVYLVFEFVEGRTLHDVLKSGGPMDLPRARGVVKEMSDAVAHAHGRSIIHRDLKPSNVMLTPEGRVKVMDFGIARLAKDALTRRTMTNTIAGTPPYMAPEQEQGNVRKESDVYSLGVCLYEMTTGFLPFTGTGAAMLLNKLNGKLIPATQRNPALPAGFDAVIAKALEPDPDKRYRTPAELVGALDALLAVRAA